MDSGIIGGIMLVGWLLGVGLVALGLLVALLAGRAVRAARRVVFGREAGAPGTAARVVAWLLRAGGLASILAGAFLLLTFRADFGRAGLPLTPTYVSQPAPDDALRRAVEDAVKPLAEDRSFVALTVGVVDGEKTAVFGFGRRSLRDSTPPDGDTVYEIGSISKVFTSLLLASLADEGRVRLDEPLQEALGEGARVAEYQGTPIRLVDLSTHTSGLPEVPDTLSPWSTSWRMLTGRNPYVLLTEDVLLRSLRDYRLYAAPGTHYAYSNFGGAALGYAVCRAGGGTYEDLVRSRIAEPLGMKDVAVALSADQQARLAPGYVGTFDFGALRVAFPADPWDMPPGAVGCGGLRSTANSLLRFLAANIDPPEGSLGRALEQAQQPLRETGMSGLRIGLGWHVAEKAAGEDSVTWHNGGTGGYASFVGFCRPQRTGVVVLANSFESLIRADGVGMTVLSALAQGKAPAAPEGDSAAASAGEP